MPDAIAQALTHLRDGQHAAAWADLLPLVARHPNRHRVLELFVQASVCAERHEEAAALLRGLRDRIATVPYTTAQAGLALCGGDVEAARELAITLENKPEAVAAYLDLAVGIAQRMGDADTTVTWLRERERRIGTFPFAWLPVRWIEQGRLGQHDAILAEIDALEAQIPAARVGERRSLRLHRAMALHNSVRFADALATAVALADEIAAEAAEGASPAPDGAPLVARIGTRLRQAQVAADVERLVLTQGLPVAVHAGTLLALTREGGFFPFDQDFDLAVLPPASSAAVAKSLVDSGLFRLDRPALDTGSFRNLVHRRTGLAVDLTEYRRDGDRFISEWRHPSGVLLRRSAVPAFSVRLVDHAGVGRRLPLPDDPAALLRATYGAWERPDPAFDTLVSAPNVMEETDYLRSVAAIRLAEALSAGRTALARHLATRLRAFGVASDRLSGLCAGLNDGDR